MRGNCEGVLIGSDGMRREVVLPKEESYGRTGRLTGRVERHDRGDLTGKDRGQSNSQSNC